jgi:hypothetical protein
VTAAARLERVVYPIVYPTCQADHHRHPGKCGAPLGAIVGPVRFVDTTRRFVRGDGRIYLRCPRRQCGVWNMFELVTDDGDPR